MSLIVEELAHVAQHGSGRKVKFIFIRQLVYGGQIMKELHGMRTHWLSLARVHAITPAKLQNASPPLPLKLLMSAGAGILFRQHLQEDAVAQTERRIPESGQTVVFEQFCVDMRTGHNDFR